MYMYIFYIANHDYHKHICWRLEWRNQVYEKNRTNNAEIEEYLNNVLLPNVKCKEDDLLPDELIEQYRANGTNLRCPKGT